MADPKQALKQTKSYNSFSDSPNRSNAHVSQLLIQRDQGEQAPASSQAPPQNTKEIFSFNHCLAMTGGMGTSRISLKANHPKMLGEFAKFLEGEYSGENLNCLYAAAKMNVTSVDHLAAIAEVICNSLYESQYKYQNFKTSISYPCKEPVGPKDVNVPSNTRLKLELALHRLSLIDQQILQLGESGLSSVSASVTSKYQSAPKKPTLSGFMKGIFSRFSSNTNDDENETNTGTQQNAGNSLNDRIIAANNQTRNNQVPTFNTLNEAVQARENLKKDFVLAINESARAAFSLLSSDVFKRFKHTNGFTKHQPWFYKYRYR